MKSPAPLIVTLEQSRGNSNAMFRRYAQDIIWPTKHMIAPQNGLLSAEHISGSRMTQYASMLKERSRTAGHQSLLPGALKNCTPTCPLAMKPFTNGSIPMPGNSSRYLYGPTRIANDAGIPDVIKRRISPRESRSKNGRNMSLTGRNPGTGKQTRLSPGKVLRRFKSVLRERPGSPNLASYLVKELAR